MNPEISHEEITQIKALLESEQKKLNEELGGIAHKGVGDTWEPVPPPQDTITADPNDVADRLEDFDERLSTEHELAARLTQVTKALARIEEGNYGLCEVSGKPIPLERLRANPAATTLVEFAQ
jgi:RNA polymerase-binding transcription factor DksA